MIAKGERIQWQRQFSDYSAEDYDLQYRFRGDGIGINVDATADGSTFVAEITSADSAKMSAGRYRWQAWMTEQADADNSFIVGSGWITIEAGFGESPTSAVETRSIAKKIVDSIDAALLAFSSTNAQSYEISTPSGTRKVTRANIKEMTDLRNYYASIVAQEYAAERGAQGKSINQTVSVRFID